VMVSRMTSDALTGHPLTRKAFAQDKKRQGTMLAMEVAIQEAGFSTSNLWNFPRTDLARRGSRYVRRGLQQWSTVANFYLDFVTRRGHRCIFSEICIRRWLVACARLSGWAIREDEEPRLFRSSALRFPVPRSVMALVRA
jgi:hypothetical protein